MLRLLALAALAAAAFAAVPLVLEQLLADRPRADVVDDAFTAKSGSPQAKLSGRKVHLLADASGHFSADFRLNGRAVPGIIDTGATMVALNRTTARRIGIDVAESAFTGWAQTANGRVRAAPVIIETLTLGRIELRDIEAVVLDDRALRDALVGMSFLSRLKRYSVEGGALALEQ